MKRWQVWLLLAVVLSSLAVAQTNGEPDNSTTSYHEGQVWELGDPESAEPVPAKPEQRKPSERMREGVEYNLDDPEQKNSDWSMEEGSELDLGFDDMPEGKSTESAPTTPTPQQAAQNSSNRLRDWLDRLPFEFRGFIEARGGIRTQNDPAQPRDTTMAEIRLQLEAAKNFDWLELRIKSDFYYDGYREQFRTDVREASALFTITRWLDIKAGRQVLTWGAGDLLFINDLFPKDWQAFFIGREISYLKAPSDAVKLTVLTDLAQFNLVYTPVFNPDRYIDGRRISFWNPMVGDFVGREQRIDPHHPNRWFRDAEWAARIFKNIEGYELAMYGYYGFWKSPAGIDAFDYRPTFPNLAVAGASATGSVLGGIGAVEFGYYHSLDDQDGDDPLVPNSEWRLLLRYERELFRDFTLSGQYYLEWMQGYSAYRRFLPPGIPAKDRVRHVVTLRATWLLLEQNLTLSLFAYYSPSDRDAYLRPYVSYKITDNWLIDIGANIFIGKDHHTFFGQFADNTNIYAGIRWNF